MSNKVFDKVDFDDKFDLGDGFLKEVMSYAIPHAVEDMDSYWRSSPAEKIITDATFGFIWKNYPDTREELLNVSHNVCRGNNRVKSLTKDFCKSFLSKMYELIEDNEDDEDVRLRIRLLPVVKSDFDYLSQMCKFSLDEEKLRLYQLWHNAGLTHSKDEAFFDYLWSKVKRAKGSVDIKIRILDCAFDNNAISLSLLKKIAKSSPKNIKRTATSKLSADIREEKNRIRRHERDNTEESLKAMACCQKIVDELESKIMMFVDCIDREVVSNLLDCLSRDNLPWLMPAASKHYYLSQRLQRMIDEDE